ncbi:hypothetical protein [Rhodoferax sp.]|uniref:hypothetical protein n=1 Tax=Rhodoferax sp. TaxID=50421 RepID=UPI00374D4ACD
MFKRIRNWIGRAPDLRQDSSDLQSVLAWAESQGLIFENLPDAADFALVGLLDGPVEGSSWRLERTAPARDFIMEAELYGRADLGLPDEVAVMLINRPLMDDLEKRGYEQAIHSVQTTLDAELPEEVRWLALYDQVGWSTAPMEFWDRYAIVADSRGHAQQWLDGDLMPLLLNWPTSAVQQITPFILQIQHGRVYLRMEYAHADLPTLQHAVAVFQQACASAQWLSADDPES